MTSGTTRTARIFIAAPSDLKEERERAGDVVRSLALEATDREPFEAYRWEAEQDRHWDAGKGWQAQIPRPSAENCEVLVCILGERLGSPLPDTDLLPADFEVPEGIVFPCVDEDEVFGDGDLAGAVPLTGTVFEYLDARQAQQRTGRPHILLFVKGDASVQARGAPADARRWGLQSWLREREARQPSGRLPRKEAYEYDRQTTFLSRFFDGFVGKSGTWQLFSNPDEFAAKLESSLRDVLGREPPVWAGNPYKRLEHYEVGESPIFRGRDHHVTEMVLLLAAADRDRQRGRIPLLIVEGESGSGKSSTLRAGLAARLQEGSERVRANAAFVACIVSRAALQGDEPLLALMARLAQEALPELGTEVAAHVRRVVPEQRVDEAADRIREAIEAHRRHGLAASGHRDAQPLKLLLALDQFEEVLHARLDGGAGEWAPVLRLLVRLAESGLAFTALGMKTAWLDELDRWLDAEHLPNRNAFASYLLLAQDVDVDKVIREPLARCKLEVAPDLHDHLKAEWTRYRSLPLLSVSLFNVYEAWEARCRTREEQQLRNPLQPLDPVPSALTLADYGWAASLSGAIDRLGGEAFDAAAAALGERGEELLASVLRRLVYVSLNGAGHSDATVRALPEGGILRGVTRRLCPESELPPAAMPLLAELRSHRLVLEEEGSVQLVHETVLYHWMRARTWLKNEQTHLKTRSELEVPLRWWLEDRSDQNPPLLYKPQVDNGERLLVAWRDEPLDPSLRAFVMAAIRQRFDDGSHARGDGTPRLVDAVRLRDEALAVHMLDRGADPEERTPTGAAASTDGRSIPNGTPLMFAASDGSERLVRLLVERGADVDAESAQRYTALDYAAMEGHAGIVRLLHEEHRARAENPAGPATTALWRASRKGHVEVLRLLLTYGADASRPDANGSTPLVIAAQYGHTEVIQLLVDAGADVRTPGTGELHALAAAAQGGHLEAVRLLLGSGADVDQATQDGTTALMAAARNGHADVLRLLLASTAADPNRQDRDAQTALHHAARTGQVEAVSVLLDHAATDPMPYDNAGHSPLYLALQGGHLTLAERLVSAGTTAPPWYARSGDGEEWKRLRGFELRRRVTEMLAGSDAPGSGSWPLPPLMEGGWTVLEADAAAALLALAVERAPAGLGCGVDRVDAVRTRPLPFYGEGRLCEARAWRDGEVAGYLTFVDHPGGTTWIDGTSSGIHQLNAELGLRLADGADVLEYLRLFSPSLQSEGAAFVLVESPERLLWLDEVPEETRHTVSAHAHALRLLDESEEEGWTIGGVVQFGNVFFDADFRVQASGLVRMLEDRPIAENLGIGSSAFRDDVRTVVPYRNDGAPRFRLDVAALLEPVSDAASPDWPIPPLMEGGWMDAEPGEAHRLLERAGMRIAPGFGWGVDRVDAVRTRPLCCYEDARLCEARAWRGGELAGYLTFVDYPGGVEWLDGASQAIEALNGAAPLRLDSEDAALDYLRFFCGAVHGPDGAFRVFESGDSLVWPAGTPEEERREAAALAQPLRLDGNGGSTGEDATWRAAGVVRYGRAAYPARFEVTSLGVINLPDDPAPVGSIGADIEVFQDGLRRLRPLQGDAGAAPLPITA